MCTPSLSLSVALSLCRSLALSIYLLAIEYIQVDKVLFERKKKGRKDVLNTKKKMACN